ncbi:MAG: DUF4114 domain-containing protein [Saprospiraceae bacterium]
MKFLTPQKALIFLSFTFLVILQSCESSMDRIQDWENDQEPVVGENIEDLVGKAGFDYQTTQTVEFALNALNSDGTAPIATVSVEIYTTTTNERLSLLARGNTDRTGIWKPELTIPADVDSLTLKVLTPGFPQWHKITTNSAVVNYTFGADNTTGRILQDPIIPQDDPGFKNNTQTLGSRSGYSYIGTVNSSGIPSYLTTPAEVGDNILDFVAANLPENRPVPEFNPQYLEENISSNIIFDEDGELWVSFIHEGAGYRNSVGYFTFDPNNPPTTVADIDARTILFPNTSYAGSGGGLNTGDRIYLGTFEKGTGVGWFLVPNGWNGNTSTVNESSTTRYSFEDLNTFTSPESRSHALLLNNNSEEFLIVAFEDPTDLAETTTLTMPFSSLKQHPSLQSTQTTPLR